jgi:hypothetical protein
MGGSVPERRGMRAEGGGVFWRARDIGGCGWECSGVFAFMGSLFLRFDIFSFKILTFSVLKF